MENTKSKVRISDKFANMRVVSTDTQTPGYSPQANSMGCSGQCSQGCSGTCGLSKSHCCR